VQGSLYAVICCSFETSDEFEQHCLSLTNTHGVALLPAGYEQGTPAQLGYGKAGRQQQQQRQQQLQQQRSGNQMPALIAKGSGQVAGAAAFAVAGAGKAIMPLFDKLATTLISDNPMLLEDLRWALW
jgi:hypothetical protein